MKKKLSTTEFIRKRQAGSPEEGEVIDPNEEIASGFAGGREPGKAEEAFRALVEGSQGFLGLEPGRRGSEAYRTGQALSNLPALALPAAAIKGTGKAKDLLEEAFRQRKTPGLEKFLEKSAVKERVYRGQRRAPGEEGFALTQGRANPSFTLDPEVANVYSRQLGWGTPEYGPGSTVVPAYLQMENPLDIRNLGEYFNLEDFVQKLPKVDLNKPTVESGFGYEDIAQMVRGIGSVANKTGARYEIDASLPGGLYRIKDFGELADAIEEMGSAGKSDEIQKLLFDANIDAFLIGDSKNVRNALKERGFDGVIHKDAFDVGGEYYEGDLSRLEGGTDAEFVHDTYRPFYQEKIKSAVGNVGDYDTTQKAITKAKGGEVSTTDFIRKREKGSPPEGEVPTDDYIQQMMTGTPPSDRTTNPGLLPPELRQAIDVPLDLANTFIRSAAGSIAGPVYGLYKGITSDKFGTPEGVQEASSEAGRMMQKISGTPKTQTGRDVMEFIGGVAEEAKIPPMPQFLTTPAPGPGSASALLRNYELAETPPVGAINVPGAKAQVTPPKNEMGFFSPTEQVVMNLPQEKGTAQQMLAQISKAPGAKAAELRATGLEEFLKSKGNAPVTRQEIQDYLASNRVQVDEVVLGKGQTLSPEAKRLSDEAMFRMEEIDDKLAKYFEGVEEVAGQDPYSAFIMLRSSIGRKAAKGDQEALNELNAYNLPPEIKDLVLEFGRNKNEYIKYTGQARKMQKPKFDKYNIPGGTNAREIYLTLPLKRTTEAEARSIVGDETWNRMTPEQRQEFMSYPTEAAKQNQFTVPSAHSVSPEADKNRLAHIFLDDRTDAEGNKVLFVQELQSDWAQQGRDKGFFDKTRLDFLDAQLKRQGKLSPEEAAEYNRLTDMENLPISTGTVFPAPFVSTQQYQVMKEGKPLVTKNKKDQDVLHIYSSPEDAQRAAERFGGTVKDIGMQENTEGWVNLALKRVIKDAVDNGYDKVAFIKGEQAAKKYGLSTVLDGIEVSPLDTTYLVYDKQSVPFPSPKQVSPGSRIVELKQKGGGIIELYVNKEGTIEVVANDLFRRLTGRPLSEVVGKEMSKKIMATELKNKDSTLFTVKDMEVGGEGMKGFYDNILPKTANKLLSKLGSKIEEVGIEDQPYLGFKITPEMADMVKTQGLPQFAAGGEVTKFIKAHA